VLRDHLDVNKLIKLILIYSKMKDLIVRLRTLSATVYIHAGEPVVADEIPLLLVPDMLPCSRIDIRFRKSKVNHIERLIIRCKPKHCVPKLNIPMQYTTRMHELQS
jgi:hypothetical protein